MNGQGDLFDGERPATEEELGMPPPGHRNVRLTDPDTSRAAAADTSNRAALMNLIDAAIWRQSGTQWEVSERIGIAAESVHKRISDLRTEGRIYDTGIRRKGPSGRYCIVWSTTR